MVRQVVPWLVSNLREMSIALRLAGIGGCREAAENRSVYSAVGGAFVLSTARAVVAFAVLATFRIPMLVQLSLCLHCVVVRFLSAALPELTSRSGSIDRRISAIRVHVTPGQSTETPCQNHVLELPGGPDDRGDGEPQVPTDAAGIISAAWE